MARKKTHGAPAGSDKDGDGLSQAAAAQQPQADSAAGDAQAEPQGGADSRQPEEKAQAKQPSNEEIIKLYIEQMKAEIARLSEENANLRAGQEQKAGETEQYKEKLERLAAEYENYRRRTAAEKDGIYADAVAKAVAALLPALDSLEKAVEYAQTNPQSYEQGVQMTLKQLADGFKNLGVSEIEAEPGVQFNPDLHNAVMHIEDEARGESEIADVFQRGYQIGDRVIRHSVVRVAN